MDRFIAHVSVLVRDYDEAIDFFTNKLDFQLIEDRVIAEQNKRWVLVAPNSNRGTALLLARAVTEAEQQAIGRQGAGRVFLFLYTDNLDRDVKRMKSLGISFEGLPREESYGRVVVFRDLYGNRWDLLQPADEA